LMRALESWRTISHGIRILAALSVLALIPGALASDERKARYLKFSEVQETIRLFAGSGLPGSEIADAESWDKWIRQQDGQVRARVDRGVEDSISNFILYGTSYTNLPRLENLESVANANGEASELARARAHTLAAAVASASRAERVRFVRDFLARKGVVKNDIERVLEENLKRFAAEQLGYQEKLEEAAKASDQTEVLLARGTLYHTRGLSADTSLLPNYALEDTLRVMAAKGAIAAGSIKRIAVIGPGLDFADKRDGYDFYPLQTIQPFAVMEAVARAGLGRVEDLRLVTLDLNPAVNAHVARVAKDATAGRAYTLQLPKDAGADWSTAAVCYWEHFGEILGKPTKPLPMPPALGQLALRAVAIAPQNAARLQPMDLNIVAQTVDVGAGQGFDLIVATNVLVYYHAFQQALALASIARLLNTGGIFLSNTVLPAQHDARLEFLGRRSVTYSSGGSYGDDVVVYRRR
jgi:SAM-dependent methyltransferase